MKYIEEMTELPKGLERIWPTLEDLKSDVAVAVKNSIRTDELLAMMLTPMTSTQADEVKGEIKAIANTMNEILSARFDRLSGAASMLAVMVFGEIMKQCLPEKRVLTPEQTAILQETGVYDELLTAGRQSK